VASVSAARERVREVGGRAGLDANLVGAMAIVASELANNQLAHGAHGSIAVRAIEREGVVGLEVVAADAGRGILDPSAAFEGAPRSSASLGAGLSSVRSLAGEVDVDVRRGEGTCIRARAFAAPAPRRREVAILGRPFPGERMSGDQAGFVRMGRQLLLFLIDGLGHGAEAREAADRAASKVREVSSLPCVEILRAVDQELMRTRGAVATIARLDEETGSLDFAGVGNVVMQLVRFRETRLFGGSSFVLGMPTPAPKRVESRLVAVEADEIVVLCSDGISSRATIEDRRDLVHAEPIAIAQHLLETFAQDTDDATVLIAR
jgi:anti-sigma regulatory factor (Ser/Thr protein kinase)